MSENECFDTYSPMTLVPKVVLHRLTAEEIQRATGKKNPIVQPSTSMLYLPINIKQEHQHNVDTVFTEQSIENSTVVNTWESTIQDLNIKNETIHSINIKTERQDTYEESLIDNPTFADYDENNLNQFNCKLCCEIFNNEEEYLVHTFLLHKDNQPHKCKICLEQFSIGAHLNLHLAQHVNDVYLNRSSTIHPTEIQSSSTSNLTMNSKNSNGYKLSLILTNNSHKSLSKVNVQKIKNPTAKSRQNYLKTNSLLFSTNERQLKSFKCVDCTFASVSEDQFSNHFTSCNAIPDRSRTSNNYFHCKLCLRSFHNHTALNGHMRYHSLRGEINTKKNVTQKNKNILKNSKSIIPKTQINLKKSCIIANVLNCKYCNKRFTSSQKLHIHNLQHKKQMVCKVCNKQFFLKKNFDKHMLIHEPFSKTPKIRIGDQKNKAKIQMIEPFKCTYCKNCFKTKRALLLHIKRYHCDAPISICGKLKPKLSYSTCNYCDKVITSCNLIRHIRAFHPKVKPLKCQHCSMKFNNVVSKKLHLNKCHRK